MISYKEHVCVFENLHSMIVDHKRKYLEEQLNWMRVVLASNNIELLAYSHKNKLIDLSPNENKPPYAMKFLYYSIPQVK